MLRSLRIENLVLIRHAELDLAAGLNAITGETGAGKTILAQAVGLLLGARGDQSLTGPDGEEAYVEAELDLPDGLLDEEGFEALAELRPEDEPGLVIARRVFMDGRTRAYAWGRSAAREDVAAVAERLIAMSGQFEQRRLARRSYQLDVLDSFAGSDQLERRAEARRAWRELQAARRRHEEIARDRAAAETRLAELRALAEDTAELAPGAEDAFRAERERLRAAVAELVGSATIDEQRVAQEVAMLADRLDVAEEIDRFRSHISAFRETLQRADTEPVGKRLAFLLQEMVREANTTGSKARDAVMTHDVVAVKEELERIAEQVENLE